MDVKTIEVEDFEDAKNNIHFREAIDSLLGGKFGEFNIVKLERLND